MKRYLFLGLMLLLLAACSPATPAVTPDDKGIEGGEGTDSGPLGVDLRPELMWDEGAPEPVIQVTDCCGFVPASVAQNYIPRATIWGDGRIIWTVYADDGSRQVLEAQLSQEQLAKILERLDTAGFFGWDDLYSNPMVADAAQTCIHVRVPQTIKSVCQYVEGAPDAFPVLFEFLAGGAGASEGTPYVPEKVFAITFPMPADVKPDASQQVFEWPADSAVKLAELEQGGWLEGSDAALAWEASNASAWGMLIRQGEQYFQIATQVEGLSAVEMPLQ